MSQRHTARLLFPLLALGAVSGCARWEPETAAGPITLSQACPLQRGPAVTDFGEAGLRGVYHFVTQDAPMEDKTAFLAASRTHGFDVVLMTININGKDTLFAPGPELLRSQAQVDAEFDLACSLGHGKVYLTHVRYDAPNPDAKSLRVR